jgi:hypothetical protein
VNRVRNAGEFLLRFQRAWGDYETHYKPRIDRVRAAYTNNPTEQVPPTIDESLEVHAREYLINTLLYALNWRLNYSPEEGLPNLVPEAPLTSAERGTRRRLDYLGLESNTYKPLLIIEAKRPGSSLPQRIEPVPEDDGWPFVVRDGLCGTDLSGEWNEWLGTLRDYVRSVKEQTGCVPQRVAITNGNWLILFADPVDAFLSNSTPASEKILIWRDRKDIESRYTELFQWLEHYSVLKETPPLTVGELPFHVAPGVVNRVMHGVRLLYVEEPGFYEPAPVIKVLPVLFLRSRYGAWLRVEASRREYRLSHKYDELTDHLNMVRESAENLLREVNRSLNMTLTTSPLLDHYDDNESFADLCGVIEVDAISRDRSTEYLIVTGTNTHYLLPEPSISECPYHDWGESQKENVESNPSPVVMRRVQNPRSFFKSGELHHCAHREVTNAKASPITRTNRDRCGPRSGRDGQAFCEIACFEECLCCRVCAFEDVCTRAQAFHLPCERS